MQKQDWKKHSKSNKLHHISFKYAYKGLKTAFKTQPNFRVHTVALVCLITISTILKNYLTYTDFVALIIVSSLVFTAELFNTAIEFLGDAVAKNKYNKNVGKAKDIASGAVLLATLFAILVGLIILLPAIIDFLAL